MRMVNHVKPHKYIIFVKSKYLLCFNFLSFTYHRHKYFLLKIPLMENIQLHTFIFKKKQF